jgi:hypothetical protein
MCLGYATSLCLFFMCLCVFHGQGHVHSGHVHACACALMHFVCVRGLVCVHARILRWQMRAGEVEVDVKEREVMLSKIFKWYDIDFGPAEQLLPWLEPYLPAPKQKLLRQLLDTEGPIRLAYREYDWSLNST